MVKHGLILLMCVALVSTAVTAQEETEVTGDNGDETMAEYAPSGYGPLSLGTMLSFSGFNTFRMGIGLFLGSLASDGHHPVGYDYGLLFEYHFKRRIAYTRFYYHLTGGVSAMLMGGSAVVAIARNRITAGLAPEIGIGLSTLFKIFYRYNFYLHRDFNGYEVAFHLCIPLRKVKE
jgi:hypothetical protein